MEILMILLSILKIIGIILVIILAILLLLLLAVLFASVKYYFEAQKYEDTKAKGEVQMFWGILKCEFEYVDGILKTKAKVLNKILYSSDNEMYNEDEVKKEDYDTQTPIVTAKPVLKKADDNKTHSDKPKTSQSAMKSETKTVTSKASENKEQKEERKENSDNKNKEPSIRRIKISDLPEYNKDETTAGKQPDTEYKKLDADYFLKMPFQEKRKIIGHVLTLLKRILKHVLPKESKIKVNVGADDPALTGQILGGIGIISGATGLDIQAKGNFQDIELTGEIYLKGRIRIGSLLFAVGRFGFSKEIFKIIKLYMKGIGDKHGE